MGWVGLGCRPRGDTRRSPTQEDHKHGILLLQELSFDRKIRRFTPCPTLSGDMPPRMLFTTEPSPTGMRKSNFSSGNEHGQSFAPTGWATNPSGDISRSSQGVQLALTGSSPAGTRAYRPAGYLGHVPASRDVVGMSSSSPGNAYRGVCTPDLHNAVHGLCL